MQSKRVTRKAVSAFSLLLASLAMCLIGMTSLRAQTFWQGVSGGDWDVAGNWNPAVVPGSANENVVNNTAATILLDSGSYTINSFSSTNPSANFELFGGSLSASVPGTSAFTMTGQLILQSEPTLSGFVVTAGGGVVLGAGKGNATLNGIAFAGGTNYTGGLATNTYLNGTITNTGNIQINGGSGYNAELLINGGNGFDNSGSNVTLNGGGTVTLNTSSGGGSVYIDRGGAVTATLTNVDNTIQGNGIIGGGTLGGMNVINGGTINANVSGSTLATSENDVISNTGLMAASGGGVLQLNENVVNNSRQMEARSGGVLQFLGGTVINNAGGSITANAVGDTVQLGNGTVVYGGTLNNTGGGTLGTIAGNVTLDGATQGTLTLNGVYTNVDNTQTLIQGTIQNNGSFQVMGGSSSNTALRLYGSSTLLGAGNITLNSAGGAATLDQVSNGAFTLENVSNTIEGSGTIGNGLSYNMTLLNDAGGTVLANAGGTLQIYGLGTVTNAGTFVANAGSTLHVTNVGNFTNFSGNTLTGGTYIVNGMATSPGTLQIDNLGSTGGEIMNNAATIILNGPNSNFVDAAGLDALSNLAANTTAASNLTITGGRNLTTSGDFSNAGTVWIGTGSIMQIGPSGSNNYAQTGGITTVNGTIEPTAVEIRGGVLAGTGFVVGNVLADGGTIAPGATASTGKLTINGNLNDTGAALNIRLGGMGAGAFDALDVTGNVNLGAGSILDISLLPGFTPMNGETFTFLDFGSLTSLGSPDFFGTDNGLTVPGGTFSIVDNGDNLTLTFNSDSGSPPNGTPEPAPIVLLASGALVWALLRRRSRGPSI